MVTCARKRKINEKQKEKNYPATTARSWFAAKTFFPVERETASGRVKERDAALTSWALEDHARPLQ